MDVKFNQFARGLDPANDRRLKILEVKKNGDELKIVVGTSEPRLPHTCFHFRDVEEFDTYISGGEDSYSLPKRFNSLMCSARPHYEALHKWEVMSEGIEWTFIAPYPEVILL